MMSAILLGASVSSCSDDIEALSLEKTDDSQTKGEMVLFSVGSSENTSYTRADDRNLTYYFMPDGSRFVCRMYYKAQVNSNLFDVSGNTDLTAWLKVVGNFGNSLYWRRNYPILEQNPELYDTYGNDKQAPAFYWQNRKDHAFLAWTDLNKARNTSFVYGTNPGSLKFDMDEIYQKLTDEKEFVWPTTGYELYMGSGVTAPTFESTDELFQYVLQKQGTFPAPSGIAEEDYADSYDYNYLGHDLSTYRSWKVDYTKSTENRGETTGTRGWCRYTIYDQKKKYEGSTTEEYIEENEIGGVKYLYNNETSIYLALIEETTDEDQNPVTKYWATDSYGRLYYDETQPLYSFYVNQQLTKKEQFKSIEHNALVFDLKRGSKNSISEQPDICQALTIKAPTGATPESNRVTLKFHHQFAQVQVNIKKALDNSVAISAGQIKKVELLGVAEKAYVFTDLDEEGKVEPSAYLAPEVSLEDRYGSSFSMFDMGEANYEPTSIKSYNAIAYGMLKAIRVTWEENDDLHYEHVATLDVNVMNPEFQTLLSGNKYTWNIELRRGALAFIQAEIEDWIVDETMYSTDGIFTNKK